ncbi:hypothetical protein H4R19_000062 [Coemansia spiralis]|nr:hypothetical protein H4R19_000062 [Coemansia spiralis]
MAKHRAQRANTFHTRAMYSIGFDLFEDAINYMVPLQVTESLEREIRSLGRIHARETVKLALFYVGPGQWSEAEILSNTRADTSLSYRNFVQSLGWPVSLATFGGYTGKLERDGSDGSTCPYFSDDGIEIAFHEVTSMPTNADDPRQLKKVRYPSHRQRQKRAVLNSNVCSQQQCRKGISATTTST